MKIKVIADLPVSPDVRPEVGSVHEVTETKESNGRTLHFIKVGGAQVGVFGHECVIVEEETTES